MVFAVGDVAKDNLIPPGFERATGKYGICIKLSENVRYVRKKLRLRRNFNFLQNAFLSLPVDVPVDIKEAIEKL